MTRTLPAVLVVDDNVALAENLAEILEGEHVYSEIAGDSAAALDKLARHEFDVVLTDIRMPGMNGVELMRCILARWPAMPIILMSAYANEAMLDEATAAGALDVVTKPLQLDQVLALIRHALARAT